MLFLSDFADQAVVLPVAAAAAILLGVLGWWRGLVAWIVAVGGTLGVMLGMKTLAVAMSFDLLEGRSFSPSGHTAAACVVYGGLAVMLLRGILPALSLAAFPVSVAALVGYTRVELIVHSVEEVLIGAVVGLLGVAALALLSGPRPRLAAAWPILAVTATTMLACHGLHLPAEAAIRDFALAMR